MMIQKSWILKTDKEHQSYISRRVEGWRFWISKSKKHYQFLPFQLEAEIKFWENTFFIKITLQDIWF